MTDDSDDLLDHLLDGADFGEETREQIVKAPFSWAGSKARSLEHLLPHIPYRKLYVDVFGGTGCVLFARRPSKIEVFNDRYSGLVDFYRCIKDPILLPQLLEWLEINVFSRELFNVYKSEWKNTVDIVERAGKWYYMIVASFGSLGRNFGRSTSSINRATAILNKLQLFWPVHYRLKSVQIENLDWTQCVKDYDSYDTVFYMDPPYMYSDVGIYDEAWRLDKHKHLLEVIHELKGFVALSGYANELYDSYDWSERISWKTRISIAAKAHTETNNLKDKTGMMQTEAEEVLWLKE